MQVRNLPPNVDEKQLRGLALAAAAGAPGSAGRAVISQVKILRFLEPSSKLLQPSSEPLAVDCARR